MDPTASRRKAQQQDRRNAEKARRCAWPAYRCRRPAGSSRSALDRARPPTPAGGSLRANQPMRGEGSALSRARAGRRQRLERPAQEMRQAAQRGALPRNRRATSPRRIVGASSQSASLRRALHDGVDAARQHQRVAHRRIALDVGLLGIDQQPAGQRLALPARQVGRVALAGDVQARLVVGKAAQPVALAQQQLAAAQAQMRVVGPAGQRHVEIAERAHPVAARRQQAGARRERRHQAMVDRQRLVIGALGLVGPAQRFQRAALVVGDGGIAGLQQRRALERRQALSRARPAP